MKYAIGDLPSGCYADAFEIRQFAPQSKLSPEELVGFFRVNPQDAGEVLQRSYDKRYGPSVFIEEVPGGYQVGWFDGDRKHLQTFSQIAEAAADYVLFSVGKGRLQRATSSTSDDSIVFT